MLAVCQNKRLNMLPKPLPIRVSAYESRLYAAHITLIGQYSSHRFTAPHAPSTFFLSNQALRHPVNAPFPASSVKNSSMNTS
jgi:hypothetical protein